MTAIIESNTTPIGVKLATHAEDLGLIGLHIGSYAITGRHTAPHMDEQAPRDHVPTGAVIYVDKNHPVTMMILDGHEIDDGVLIDILSAARALTLEQTAIHITDNSDLGLNISVDDPISGWMVRNFFSSHENQMVVSETAAREHRVFFGPDPIGEFPQPIIQLENETVLFQYDAV